jgi:hypothetical protein
MEYTLPLVRLERKKPHWHSLSYVILASILVSDKLISGSAFRPVSSYYTLSLYPRVAHTFRLSSSLNATYVHSVFGRSLLELLHFYQTVQHRQRDDDDDKNDNSTYFSIQEIHAD